MRRRCSTAGPAASNGALLLIGLSSATVSVVPGTVLRLPKLCHSTAYRPGVKVMVNGSPVSLGCKIRYSLPGCASANPVSLRSVRGDIVVS